MKEKILKYKIKIEDKKIYIASNNDSNLTHESTVSSSVFLSNNVQSKYSNNLNDKVDNYIDWYYRNVVKGNYTDIGEYHLPKEMRDLIEKIAVWYELRYPDYVINSIMRCCGQEKINVHDIMFKTNPYFNDISYNNELDEKLYKNDLNWSEFYNTDVFISALPYDERCWFKTPKYNDIIYFENSKMEAHIHLTSSGIVEEAEGITYFTNGIIKNKELIGLHIKEVCKLFKERGIKLPKNNEMEKNIQLVDKYTYLKDEMLNCAMYRIIERGGNRIGPRRAFLFAKEFARNIEIPMIYGIDYSDPGLLNFINTYLEAGGSLDLECYIGYFSKTKENEKLETISIRDLISKLCSYKGSLLFDGNDDLNKELLSKIGIKVEEDIKKKKELKY